MAANRTVSGTHSLDAGTIRIAANGSETLSFAVDAGRVESTGFREDTELAAGTLRLSARLQTARGPVSFSLGYAGRRYGAYGFYGTRFPDQQETTRTRTAQASAELAFGEWTLVPSFALRARQMTVSRMATTYSGEGPFLIIGSSGCVEISVPQASAAALLQLSRGDRVAIVPI